ncbi:MAG: hypothetical protein KAR38_00950, partial [Calditrichia bacterium]|nr:hypothetical protein [Calditrichia bacterium]
RYFKSIDYALKYYGEWFMPYPYPKITMVDPPLRALAAGGMEYPMFITCGSIWGIPDNIRLGPEIVTIHEFGHNYFQGIIASNEFEEAWLDEGMNTYAEHKITSEVWGEWSSVLDIGIAQSGNYAAAHEGLIKMQRKGKIYQKSWEYLTRGEYGFNSYDKSSLLLKTLENYLGWEVMKKVWKEYFRRFAFKHPKTEDFIKTVEDISGKNMSWFFDQYLYSDAVVDYKVRWVKTKPYKSKDSTDTRKYLNEVCLMRTSDGTFPIEAQVVFSNNDTILVKWNDKNSSKIFELPHEEKVIEVNVDPEMKNYLDINWTNNSWRRSNSMAWLKYLEKRYIYLLQNLFLIITH